MKISLEFSASSLFQDKDEAPPGRGNNSNSNAKFLLIHQIFNVSRKKQPWMSL